MKKLRLLFTDKCDRDCEGCCNKGYDLAELPVVTDYNQYDLIMITGGEPLLFPNDLEFLIDGIRIMCKPGTKIYLYTASDNVVQIYGALLKLDGLSLTLHEPGDRAIWRHLVSNDMAHIRKGKSLRLNAFKGINFTDKELKLLSDAGWDVRINMEWVEDSPLPEDEDFRRMKT